MQPGLCAFDIEVPCVKTCHKKYERFGWTNKSVTHPALVEAPHAARPNPQQTANMASSTLSVGDVLMQSQTAWKIGRTFSNKRQSTPVDFTEIERESNALSEALKMLAEALHSNDTVLHQAEGETKAAVNTILESAKKTLSDLESFVERYQVIRKKETSSGFVVERNWSEVVIAGYKTFKWTAAGGDMDELRNLLHLHTRTITMTTEVLRSRSLARLDHMVIPMAESMSNVHARRHHDESGDHIQDAHDSLDTIVSDDNSVSPLYVHPGNRWQSAPNSARSSVSATIEHRASAGGAGFARPSHVPPVPIIANHSSSTPTPVPPPRHPGRDRAQSTTRPKVRARARTTTSREDSVLYTSPPGTVGPVHTKDTQRGHEDYHGRSMDLSFEKGYLEDDRNSIGAHLDISAPSPNDSAFAQSEPVSRRESNVPRRESTTLPHRFEAIDLAIDEHDFATADSNAREHPGLSPSPNSRSHRPWRFSGPSGSTSLLPPPAIAGETHDPAPATPSSFFGAPRRGRPSLPANPTPSQQALTRPHTAKPASRRQSPTFQLPGASYSDGSQFERQLFRNSAILCDVRGRLVEYSRTNPDEPDLRYNVEMVEACKEARICVVRKRENREHVGTKVVTSIWVLSTDGTHRVQHKLSEINETVPYCSYFEPEKVSIQPVDGPNINLKFHADVWGAPLQDEHRTSWVNYYFASANDAVAFQSAVFGRTLVGSYRTTKTTVIHPGLRGTFAFEEQFANIEMLRLWEDDGVSTPGAQGGLLALLHVSSNFGSGWARWWINSSLQEVRIKADTAKHAKVKGIDITVVRPGLASTSGTSNSSTTASPSITALSSSASYTAGSTPGSISTNGNPQAIDTAAEPASASSSIENSHLVPPPLTRVDTSVPETPSTSAPIAVRQQRRDTVKRVTGLRIEFKTEEERDGFLDKTKRAQERCLPLPERI
jgi:hypothetical protein